MMFTKVEQYTNHLRILAKALSNDETSCFEALDALRGKDSEGFVSEEAYEAVTASCGRVQKICRFILGMLDINSTVSTQDVLWLVSYTGQGQALEKNLSELVRQHWNVMADEYVRTAATSVKLRPERDRTLQTLQGLENGSIQLTTERLEQLTDAIKAITSGMRKLEVRDLNTLLRKVLTSEADAILANSHLESDLRLRTRWVSALICALKQVELADHAARVTQWMTENQQAMSLADLVDLSHLGEKDGGLVSSDAIQPLLNRLSKVVIPEDKHEVLVAAQKLVVQFLRGVIKEAAAMAVMVHVTFCYGR